MFVRVLTLLVVASAGLMLRAEYLGPEIQVYVLKPLTTTLILLIAAQVRRPVSRPYKLAVMGGLIFSLAGDVLLMLPSGQFVLGLVSFLVAHIFYIVAFRSGSGWGFSRWTWVPFVVFGAIMFGILAPGLDQFLVPVLVYLVVILVMAWQAWERWRHTGQRSALLAFLGAVLFVVSDSALAINRFRVGYEAASIVIWGTYVPAQWLIALSVRQGATDTAAPKKNDG